MGYAENYFNRVFKKCSISGKLRSNHQFKLIRPVFQTSEFDFLSQPILLNRHEYWKPSVVAIEGMHDIAEKSSYRNLQTEK